jgi:hypothetical protein
MPETPSACRGQGLTCSRVVYTRLIILRPILLSAAVKGSLNNSVAGTDTTKTATALVEDHLRLDMCKLCVQTAHDVLEVVRVASRSPNRASPWHALYCMSIHVPPLPFPASK